ATPHYLLAMPQRYPNAVVVRLERNYRSTPQVLDLANRLVPKLGGAEKTLRADVGDGPPPELCAFDALGEETEYVVGRIRTLHGEGVALEEMAILCRTNARTTDFEEALHDAGIPFQGASLLDREAARQLLKRLGASDSIAVAVDVRRAAVDQGYVVDPPDKLGERELVRQQDLARLIQLAEQFDGRGTVADFVADLRERFGPPAGTGVHLLTLHRAKGLEWDAVFLPRVEEKELPIRQARTGAALGEERRLLYVGLTRARRWVHVTWSGKPSRFLDELGVSARAPQVRAPEDMPPGFGVLRTWRLERAKADEVPPYVVLHNSTLAEIAERQPRTLAELARVPGVGPAKLERYGADVLAALATTG
ncbi:MAG: ATP-dependent DNA helicase UvrD2, partial [Chloroflexi bacterium]